MKHIKQKLAVLLAALLMLPVQPMTAVGALPSEIQGRMLEANDLEKEEMTEVEKTAEENEDTGENRTTGAEKEEGEDELVSEEEVIEKEEIPQEDDIIGEDETDGEDETTGEEEITGTDETSGKDGVTEDSESTEENGSLKDDETKNKEETSKKDEVDEEEIADEDEILEEEELLEEPLDATPSNALSKIPDEEIIFNTGTYEVSVVSYEDFLNNELGDAYFKEDGSYTINIPEENPFFPYEVQFIHDGKVTREWFMAPDDSVEVGGHTFYVSAYFDGSAVTQMTMEIAGNMVVVYPEKKKFTDGDGAMTMSLLPLEKRYLSLDVSAYTPVELTTVSIASIFVGDQELKDTDKVMWTLARENSYDISSSGDRLDLSYETSYSYPTWEMIVGEDDQLASSNIRYFVKLDVKNTHDWLIPSICKEDNEGIRTEIPIIEYRYSDYYGTEYDEYGDNDNGVRRLYTFVPVDQLSYDEQAYVSLKINPSVFSDVQYEQLKIYEGRYFSAEEAEYGVEITDQIYDVDLRDEGSGYLMHQWKHNQWVTLVTFDTGGKVTGCLPIYLSVYRRLNTPQNDISTSLYIVTENSRESVSYSTKKSYNEDDDCYYIEKLLYGGCPINGKYYLIMESYKDGIVNSDEVTAAYVGQYATISEAVKSGALDIKEQLFANTNAGGYVADYSQGVYFTIFIGEDDSEKQEVLSYCINAVEGTIPLNGDTVVKFNGLKDKDGNNVSCYVVDEDEDSYAEYNYLTILVGNDVNVTNLAPIFTTYRGLHLYAEGSNSPEISGESFHDFSEGPIQYTASAENGTDAKNYWLQIVKATDGEGWLYVNSLADEDSETRYQDGVTYSTREVFLDGFHGYFHDILIANMGSDQIDALSAELISDEVTLDDYWTMKGKYELSGFQHTIGSNELSNLAKIRIKAKADVEPGKEISGLLTLKAGDTVLMVLTLTGTVGDPSIITEDIPQAVKYVPYGTMIQNSNKYSWNELSYRLVNGELPIGMELKPNGEIYGVPAEAGTFSFTVRLENSETSLSFSERSFELIVNENTDENVEAATDQGYNLIQRVQNITLNSSADQTLVSQGIYAEFVDIFLDGVKLQRGVDYAAESGSTRITIRNQTLKASNKTGTHTLGIEFRTKDTNDLKRAAQNYNVSTKKQDSGSSSSDSSASKATGNRDSKKGFMNDQSGIITGTGEGYSRWQQDENGWKLIYADGTVAAGYMAEQPNGTTAEQVLWEKINGFYYTFGANGYLKSGWIFDYQLNSWYYISVETGMISGWHKETQDGYFYYLNPANGQIVTGWKQIDDKWYYFTELSLQPTWILDEDTGKWVYDDRSNNKPFGSMYHNEKTPDGYLVTADGSWDGKEK